MQVLRDLSALSEEGQKQVLSHGLGDLPEKEQKVVLAQAGLRSPSQRASDFLWLIVVLSFAAVLVGAVLLLYFMTRAEVDTAVIVPIVTTVLGALVGLLAPSPVQKAT